MDFVDIFWRVGAWPKYSRLDFAGNPDYDPEPE